MLRAVVKVEKHTSGVGVAATRREKVAMIDEVKAMNRILCNTDSFVQSCQLLFSFHSRIIAYLHTEDSIYSREVPFNLG